jgi:hypothetical protein
MAQMVSANHKRLINIIKQQFPNKEIIAWPDSEVNLGQIGGMFGVNLRADIWIWWDEDHSKGICIEYQSEIHSNKNNKSDWFDYNEIAGRDGLKKELCVKIGAGFVEVWHTDDFTNNAFIKRLVDSISLEANNSNIKTMNYTEASRWRRKENNWKSGQSLSNTNNKFDTRGKFSNQNSSFKGKNSFTRRPAK